MTLPNMSKVFNFEEVKTSDQFAYFVVYKQL